MRLYEQQYTTNPPTSPAWYATLNVVLAIGGLICEDEISMFPCPPNTKGATEGEGHALSYLRNCYSVFTQLAFSCREIMAVQALTGMVCNLPSYF
jgi:hypothetical protein